MLCRTTSDTVTQPASECPLRKACTFQLADMTPNCIRVFGPRWEGITRVILPSCSATPPYREYTTVGGSKCGSYNRANSAELSRNGYIDTGRADIGPGATRNRPDNFRAALVYR